MSTNYDIYYRDNIFDIPIYKSLNETVSKYNDININENIKLNDLTIQHIQDREPFKNYDNLIIYKKIFYLICCFFIIFLFFYFFVFKKN
jgi:hypothetical protein